MDDAWVPKVIHDEPWTEAEYDAERELRPFAEFGWAKDSAEWLAADRFLKRSSTPAGLAARRSALLAFLRWASHSRLPIRDLNEDDAEQFVEDEKRRRRHPTTIAMRIGQARGFYKDLRRTLKKEGILIPNPFADIHPDGSRDPRNPTPALPPDAIGECLAAIRRDFDHPEHGLAARRDYAIVTTYLYSAARSVEVRRMRVMDFYRMSEGVGVRLHGKTGDEEARVRDLIVDAIGEWIRAFERARGRKMQPSDPVFVSLSFRDVAQARGSEAMKPMTEQSLSNVVRKRLRDVGVTGKRVAGHALRATSATAAIVEGATLLEVQRHLRHKRLETTVRYVDRAKLNLRNAADLLQFRVESQTPDTDAGDDDEATDSGLARR